jgi:hypothetical protein
MVETNLAMMDVSRQYISVPGDSTNWLSFDKFSIKIEINWLCVVGYSRWSVTRTPRGFVNTHQIMSPYILQD